MSVAEVPTEPTPQSPFGWTPVELADLVGMNVQWIRQRMARGEIPVFEMSPRRRYVPHEWVRDNYLRHYQR